MSPSHKSVIYSIPVWPTFNDNCLGSIDLTDVGLFLYLYFVLYIPPSHFFLFKYFANNERCCIKKEHFSSAVSFLDFTIFKKINLLLFTFPITSTILPFIALSKKRKTDENSSLFDNFSHLCYLNTRSFFYFSWLTEHMCINQRSRKIVSHFCITAFLSR